jgi:hypothetical protein
VQLASDPLALTLMGRQHLRGQLLELPVVDSRLCQDAVKII